MIDYLKNEAYREDIIEFKDILRKIGIAHQWTLSDIKARFSNELFDKLFFDDVPLKEKK
jgi:hypothetical protein